MEQLITVHKNVSRKNGEKPEGGVVYINGHLGIGFDEQNQYHWVALSAPINESNEVHVLTLKFESHNELIEYFISIFEFDL